MVAYFLEKPYLILLLAALIALTIFVCIKAGKASSKRYKENEKIIKKLKEENALRNEFAILTASLAEKAAPERLFKGVALNLQKKISDASDMNAAFDALTEEQRKIYALSFVIEDGSEKLSGFFKVNGQPLTGAALNCVKTLFGGKIAEIFESEYNAFDPDNENTSYIAEEIKKLDDEFSSIADENTLTAAAGNYIKEYIERFI